MAEIDERQGSSKAQRSPVETAVDTKDRKTKGVPEDSGHIRALDGVRGFAVLLVFGYHSLSNDLEPTSRIMWVLKKVALEGWAGVDLFFVLSGFLITTILLDTCKAENYFRVFYVRRALRIFPMYYLVFIYALISFPQHVAHSALIEYALNLSNLPTAFGIFLIPSLLHFWSLAIEEQFYLVWPSMIRWFSIRTIAYFCLATIVGLFVIRNLPNVLRANAHWPELVYRLTPFRVDTLCGGALLAILVKYKPTVLENRWVLRVIFGASLSILLACGRSYTQPYVVRFGYTALVLCGTSLIALTLFRDGWTSRAFSIRGLRVMGKYSYSFYLIHPFVVNWIYRHHVRIKSVLIDFHLLPQTISQNATALLFSGAALMFVLAVSVLVWRFFEGPILKYKKHFRYAPRPEQYLA